MVSDSRQLAIDALSSQSQSPSLNRPPIAIDDRVETTVGTPVLIDVLANDYDLDGDSLQITALTMPGHGALAVVAPGMIRYAPQAGFSGIDYFSYTIADDRTGHEHGLGSGAGAGGQPGADCLSRPDHHDARPAGHLRRARQ